VIGESGTGWCELQELRSGSETPSSLSASASDIGSDDGSMSDLSSFDGDDGGAGRDMNMDPSQSFVLPTLDFSSSFLAPPVSLNPTLSPSPTSITSTSPRLSERDLDLFSYASSDGLSDFDYCSSSSSDSDSGVSSTFSFHDGSSLSSGNGSWSQEQQPSWYGSSSFGFGFSSEFVGRLGAEQGGEGPREYMF